MNYHGKLASKNQFSRILLHLLGSFYGFMVTGTVVSSEEKGV